MPKKKEFKVISHAERLGRAGDFESKCGKFTNLTTVQEEITYEKDKDGYIYAKRTFKTIPLKGRYKDYRVSDFSLNNLIITGAVQNLKPSKLIGDVDKSIDNIDRAGLHLDDLAVQVQQQINIDNDKNIEIE